MFLHVVYRFFQLCVCFSTLCTLFNFQFQLCVPFGYGCDLSMLVHLPILLSFYHLCLFGGCSFYLSSCWQFVYLVIPSLLAASFLLMRPELLDTYNLPLGKFCADLYQGVLTETCR